MTFTMSTLYMHVRKLIGAVAILALGSEARAQGARALSLEEALKMAESQSEALRIAGAGMTRAEGQRLQARSQYLPQLGASLNYSRTLATQFDALASGAPPVPPAGTPPAPPPDNNTYYSPCLRYLAPSGATDAARVAGLETYARCAASQGGGIDFSKVGFGSPNSYTFGLSGSLTLYSGGRVQAQNRAADAGKRSASLEVSAQRALLTLQVTEAYYDATLADRLVAIAESSLVQTTNVLRQTTLARQVGNQSEFELLRAQVTRDNQLPVVLQRRTDRDLAYLRLKQMLNMPYSETLQLTTSIETGMPAAAGDAPVVQDTTVDDRASVRQLAEGLRAQEAQLVVSRAQRFPTVTLSTQYAKLAFPRDYTPDFGNLLTNWTVALGATFPLYTGGAIKGGAMIAQASIDESRARLAQTRELAALEARQAAAQFEQARSALAASGGTSEQAARAYRIAEVRYREGLSTQVELSESRLLLEQAQANRAQAARNLHVARMRLQLLKDLPLGTILNGGSMGGMGGTPANGTGVAAPQTTVRTVSAVPPGTGNPQ